jgi:hypothetical protein
MSLPFKEGEPVLVRGKIDYPLVDGLAGIVFNNGDMGEFPEEDIVRTEPPGLEPGALQIGITEDYRDVIINHPDLHPDVNGVGHIIFSPEQAKNLARLLLEKAEDIERHNQ